MTQYAEAVELGPVTLDEIRELRRERTGHAEIVDLIAKRGLGFELDRDTERILRRLGFRRANLTRLKTMRAGEIAGADAGPNVAPQRDPRKETEYQHFAERIERIRNRSQTDTVTVRSEHITLICNKGLAARVLPDVKRLEQLLAKRFPAPLGLGPDRRVANIALFPTRYEYEKWIRAMFQVYEEEGIHFTGMDALNRAMRTQRYLVRGIFSCCLEKTAALQVRHSVAYAVGYHYIEQLTESRAPAALMTGFGNETEVMLLGRPSMMLNSGYAERELGGRRNPWATIVMQYFTQNKVPPVADVLEYQTSAMELPQYAQCWSLASLLATGSKEFAALVLAMHNGEPALAAIEKIYGVSTDELHERWRKYSSQVR